MQNLLIALSIAAGATTVLAFLMRDRRGIIHWFVWTVIFGVLAVLGAVLGST